MDTLNVKNIRLNVPAASKEDALKAVAALAVELGYASDENVVMKGLQAREALGSTGMEGGFAIPHVLDDEIRGAGVLVLRTSGDIADWETFDDAPVNFIIALLAPKNSVGGDHLKLLSSVSRVLVHEENRQALRTASTPQEIFDVLSARIQ